GGKAQARLSGPAGSPTGVFGPGNSAASSCARPASGACRTSAARRAARRRATAAPMPEPAPVITCVAMPAMLAPRRRLLDAPALLQVSQRTHRLLREEHQVGQRTRQEPLVVHAPELLLEAV